ncbi:MULTISPECIES: D-hexose-6-phosphate mutarotase [unclassified Picosynechococcus]|uniref:D-hexose-6-phosphate mutarotase n=1 Tax=unclassified Picosynechococcus TaxID=3079910 RepID=UPI0007457DF0|nr:MULTISPECIES: D-hexose-6-phosphate mutarotase [unclassified Picosynechococcus]AMA08258.1 D-hexose-6-phosphate mutarotase [Picosynechococcus sp. PCC 73109]ANV89569.1 D-hexose-6-phosphate mutarotase [Picosynechococcus sp. PCC 8807]
MHLDQLNQQYGLPELSFGDRQRGFPVIKIKNRFTTAEISLYGGQVLSFQPSNAQADLLFLSDRSHYQPGKAIRGGIPICWPWFGADPDGLGRANHGFARDRLWTVRHTETLANGATRVILSLQDDEETRKIWDYAFELAIAITVSESLDLELTSHNRDQRPMTITQALHTYFTIGDIQRVKVLGLAGLNYIDKVDSAQQKSQIGEVTIQGEVDRIYQNTAPKLFIDDPSLERKIEVCNRNSTTTIVWNPGMEKTATMGDLSPDAYQRFLCVETANAAAETITLAPGTNYSLGVTYCLAPLD